jgi:hypothetical protein
LTDEEDRDDEAVKDDTVEVGSALGDFTELDDSQVRDDKVEVGSVYEDEDSTAEREAALVETGEEEDTHKNPVSLEGSDIMFVDEEFQDDAD